MSAKLAFHILFQIKDTEYMSTASFLQQKLVFKSLFACQAGKGQTAEVKSVTCSLKLVISGYLNKNEKGSISSSRVNFREVAFHNNTYINDLLNP